MTELLTAAQMRAIEQAAIASGEVTGLELMERAGRGVVEAIFEEWPELRATSHRAVVLCGPGNNGGDGFVVARLLKEWGWEVEVFLYGDPERLPPDARVNYERWRGMGEVSDFSRLTTALTKLDLFVDALFGTGINRALTDGLEMAINEADAVLPEGLAYRVAIDIPSGICADSGRYLVKDPPGDRFFADRPASHQDLTVTFHRPKRGHVLADGAEWCGKLIVRPIGLDHGTRHPPSTGDTTFTGAELEDLGKTVRWRHGAHKYSHGHALILSGPPGHTGAARLAARGALRIGAGLVTVGCPPEAVAEHAARLDAVMLRAIADGGDLTETLTDPRINALCLGPGLGLDDRARGLVAAALEVDAQRAAPGPAGGARSARPVGGGSGAARRAAGRNLVLDADALTILSRHPDLFAALHEGCALTPHAGEFARLFPDIAEKLAAPATKGPAYSKVDATREAAKRAGCVVLFKGPDTVIADPSGRCSINSAHYDRAAPWLATAGSGDVLAGFIAGLLARGFAPMQAAETAAWLHVECARSFGPGLIAEDLPEELPKVFRALGL